MNTQRIKLEMKRFGWTQVELGRKMKPPMSRHWIWWAFNADGNHTFSTVEKFAKVFEMDSKELII